MSSTANRHNAVSQTHRHTHESYVLVLVIWITLQIWSQRFPYDLCVLLNTSSVVFVLFQITLWLSHHICRTFTRDIKPKEFLDRRFKLGNVTGGMSKCFAKYQFLTEDLRFMIQVFASHYCLNTNRSYLKLFANPVEICRQNKLKKFQLSGYLPYLLRDRTGSNSYTWEKYVKGPLLQKKCNEQINFYERGCIYEMVSQGVASLHFGKTHAILLMPPVLYEICKKLTFTFKGNFSGIELNVALLTRVGNRPDFPEIGDSIKLFLEVCYN